MALFEWDKSYELGIEEIDNQHKGLVKLINELHQSMLELRTQEIMAKTLADLLEYTIYHFEAEEELMSLISYDNITNHKLQHQKFLREITTFKNDYKAGKKSISMSLLSYLKDWLIHHIQKSDKEFSDNFHNH
jgi:hemerythrin